jgi:hypothetical protein
MKDVELGDGGKRRRKQRRKSGIYGLFNKPDCVGTAVHCLSARYSSETI